MKISSVPFNAPKVNVAPSFGALLFKMGNNGYYKEGLIKQDRYDKAFKAEFLDSLYEADREAVLSIEKMCKNNKLVDILIEKRLLSKDIILSVKPRKSNKPFEEAVIIGTQDHKGIEIEPRHLIQQLGKCYAQAQILKDELQKKKR